jgi:4-hydroxy-2-oxoheptanedioate aldolase
MRAGELVRARLVAEEPVFVAQLGFPHPGLAEFLGRLGFHCVLVDGEHGPLDDGLVEDVARAAELGGAASIVRFPFDAHRVERYLAMGISGIHVPSVETASRAFDVVASAKLSPWGSRGLGGMRATGFGLHGPWTQQLKDELNAASVVMVAIETEAAAAAAADIAGVRGVDAVLVGEADLADSMGLTGRPDHPAVRRVADAVVTAARGAGKAAGLAAGDRAEVQRARDRGATVIYTSVPALLRGGVAALLGDALRGEAPLDLRSPIAPVEEP